MIAFNKGLARKFDALERKLESHDDHIRSLFEAIRQLMTPPEPEKHKISFLVEERAARYGKRQAAFTSTFPQFRKRGSFPTFGSEATI